MRALLRVGLLGCFLGCGGLAGDPVGTDVASSPGVPGGPPPAPAPPSSSLPPPTSVTPAVDGLAIVGSFDVTFAQVTATGGSSAEPAPPTQKARLDIRAAGKDGYEAVMTARWGRSGVLHVAVAPATLTLTGNVTVDGTWASGTVRDQWQSIVLGRSADGKLSGAFQATGSESILMSDVGENRDLIAKGTLAPDVTAPELRVANAGGMAPSGPLPWDLMVFDAAEPIDPALIMQGTVDENGKLSFHWEPAGPSDVTWAGQTRFVGRVSDWSSLVGHAPGGELVEVPFGPDLAGLEASGPVLFGSSYLDVSPPAQPWGARSVQGGDPCESGGCLMLGPSNLPGCPATDAGLPSYFPRGATGHVTLRYRVLARAKLDATTTPFLWGTVATFEVASPDASTEDHAITSPALTALATPIDGMTHASAWTTLDVLAPGTGPIGVAVALGDGASAHPYCGPGSEISGPFADIELVVQSIDAL